MYFKLTIVINEAEKKHDKQENEHMLFTMSDLFDGVVELF